jgi:hypothetical protein
MWRVGCGTFGAFGVLTGLAFLAGLATWLPHTVLAPFVPPQHVERPEAGFAVSFPLDWEYADIGVVSPDEWWDRDKVEDVQAHHEQVVADGGLLVARTRSPFAFHFCVLYDITEWAAEPPAWTSLAHVPTDARDWTDDSDWAWDVRNTYLELPAGRSLRADVLWASGTKASDYFYVEGTRWFQLDCGTEDRPPEDRWQSIADSFEFLPVDAAEPAARRIEHPEAGLALTLPYGWQIEDAEGLELEDWYDSEAYDDVREHHAAKLAGGLLLKTRAFLPDEPTYQSCDLWEYTSEEAQRHVMDADRAMGALAVETEILDLPAGRAVVIDTAYRDGRHYRDYVVTDGERWGALICGSRSPPDDRWLSIAETIEFLPAEE